MGDITREKQVYLARNGFRFVRTTKHGELWTDGYSTIQISGTPRAGGLPQFLKDLRKALRVREAKERPIVQAIRDRVEAMDTTSLVGDSISERVASQIVMTAKKPAQAEAEDNKEQPIMEPAEEKQKRFTGRDLSKAPKYPPEMRKKVRAEATRLWEKGYSARQSSELMNQAGFRTAGGKEFDYKSFSNICVSIGLGRRRENEPNKKAFTLASAPVDPPPPVSAPLPPPPVAKSKAPNLPDAVVNILTDPELSDKQKVRMLLAWLG